MFKKKRGDAAMLEIILVVIPPVCLFLHWLLECLELKQVKEHRNRLSEQNDALWEIVNHLAHLQQIGKEAVNDKH